MGDPTTACRECGLPAPYRGPPGRDSCPLCGWPVATRGYFFTPGDLIDLAGTEFISGGKDNVISADYAIIEIALKED